MAEEGLQGPDCGDTRSRVIFRYELKEKRHTVGVCC